MSQKEQKVLNSFDSLECLLTAKERAVIAAREIKEEEDKKRREKEVREESRKRANKSFVKLADSEHGVHLNRPGYDSSTIYNKLNKLYEDKKSRNFVLHLIANYLPFDNSRKVYSLAKKAKCSLTNQPLIGVYDAMELIQKITPNQIKDDIRSVINGKLVEPIYKQVLNGRALAWTGKKTDTMLTSETIAELYEFTTKKMMQGDKVMNHHVKRMRLTA